MGVRAGGRRRRGLGVSVAYESAVGRLGTGPIVPLATLVLREHAGFGWSGWGRVRQADEGSAAALFARAQEHGLVPGAPVLVSLSPAGEGPVRSWPSILTDLEVLSNAGAVPAVLVRLADPLAHLGTRPLYGAFAGRSPGQILAGCLARAAGVAREDGSLRIAHPSFPTVRIRERVREDLARLPYAIASGEPLLGFIRSLLRAIGVRLAVRGLASGEIRVELTDRTQQPDASASDAVRLAAMFEARTGEGVLSVRRLLVETTPGTGTAMMNPDPILSPGLSPILSPGLSRGPSPDVEIGSGAMGGAASGGPGDPNPPLHEEGGLDELLRGRGAIAAAPRMLALSEEPALQGDGRVELTHETVAGARAWRVLAVTHRLADRGYRNASLLEEDGVDLDADGAMDGPPPRTLTGFVGDEGSEDGAPVPIDPRGRIPVRLACEAKTVVRLPFVLSSAGAVHGFAPACCQGDRVRVRVHGPLLAEIEGAVWSEALSAGEEARGAAQAMEIAAGLGVAFHPAAVASELAG